MPRWMAPISQNVSLVAGAAASAKPVMAICATTPTITLWPTHPADRYLLPHEGVTPTMASTPALRPIILRGGIATAIAVVANLSLLAVVLVTEAVTPFGALTVPPVAFLTLLAGIAATAVYGAITRLWPHPDRLFARLAAVVLVLSFVPDLIVLRYDETATAGAVLVLMMMHVVTALILLRGLTGDFS